MMVSEFRDSANKYAQALNGIIALHDLPPRLFREADHFGFACASPEGYERRVAEVLSASNTVCEINRQNRRVAIALLNARIAIERFSAETEVSTIEILEPTPDQPNPGSGVRFMGFVFRDILPLSRLLETRDVDYTMEGNGTYGAVVLPFGDQQSQVKFTNKTLSLVAKERLEDGTARIIRRTA